jgi:hypothetical protein
MPAPGARTPGPGPGAGIQDDDPTRRREHELVPGQWRTAGDNRKPSRSQAEPSLVTVLATTISLWFERHTRRSRPAATPTRTGHPPASHPPAGQVPQAQAQRASEPLAPRWRWFRLVTLGLVVALAAVAGVALARDNAKTPAPRSGSTSNPVLTAQAARTQAADWIAAQVSKNAIVSCDPVMCSALQAHGFPGSNLDQLGPSAPDPLDSSLIVATNVLRSQFGTRLTSVYAPVVLASFGTGTAAVQVRAVAPDGAPAYLAQLSSDFAARKSYGRQLLHNSNVIASAAAKRELGLGQVDSRLISVIGTMAQKHSFEIVSFGGAAAGESAQVPLRSAILASRTSGSTAASVLESLRSFLIGQQPPYLPATTQIVRLPSGQNELSIRFAAPYPLGLLGTSRSVVKIPAAG